MRDCIEKLPGAFFLSFPEKKDFLISEVAERFPHFSNPVFYGDLVYYPGAKVSFASVPNVEVSTVGAKAAGVSCGCASSTICEGDVAADGEPVAVEVPYWCATAMLEPKKVEFASIGEAARLLKEIQRNWGSYQFTQFRRAALIQEKLPYINTKEKQFPFTIPSSPIGLYTLLDSNHMVFSEKTSSSLPAGLFRFVEDHVNPPSRAYLKIQEALVRFAEFFGCDGSDTESSAKIGGTADARAGVVAREAGGTADGCNSLAGRGTERADSVIPKEGERCFDAGACPGGWTWVLRKLGCNVLAVDRAPLADSLMNDPCVSFMTHDAFTLKPQDLGFFDWVFSDVICYPERLYDWVLMWLESGMCRNMICTIKMQGATDWSLVKKFADIPNSKVVHLCYNKHELTWLHSGVAK